MNNNTIRRQHIPSIAIVILGYLSILSYAQEELTSAQRFTQEIGDDPINTDPSLWISFVNLCDTIAPFCGIIVFLAPLQTINQINKDKTVGSLPLLPYSSMVSNSFVWVCYGLLKGLPSVYMSNAVGLLLGAYYFKSFIEFCGPMSINLPGTVSQHIKGAGCIILLNLCLALSGLENASEIIGKEGVLYCIILFASPLAALKHVIVSKSAASIPTPFTLACLLNCMAWTVVGWWKIQPSDFNIYFPNMMGLTCAGAQIVLKSIYGNSSTKDLPK